MATTMRSTTSRAKRNETASEAYKAKLAEVRAELARIELALDMHEDFQANEPRNWGYVGDLGSMLSTLAQIPSFVD